MAIPEFSWKSSIPTTPSLKNGLRNRKQVAASLKTNKGVYYPEWVIDAPLLSKMGAPSTGYPAKTVPNR
jgi:hypothetical protein